jgi:signal transduction histidine kinase
LPQIIDEPKADLAALSRYADSCDPRLLSRRLDLGRSALRLSHGLAKALLWQRFVCGERALPAEFFETSPWVHPSGLSYVELARKSGKPEFQNPGWLAHHESGLHLLELLREPAFRQAGLEVQPGDLANLLRGEPVVLTRTHALVALPPEARGREARSGASYAAYPRDRWDSFVSAGRERPARGRRAAAVVLLIGLGGLLVALARGARARAQGERREQADRLFILQMLTHELRTPATAIRLSVEAFRRDFDALPDESQKAFLRICEELQRLDRVVDASRSYLKAGQASGGAGAGAGVGASIVKSRGREPAPPVSANQLLERIVEPYFGRVAFRPLVPDLTLSVDRYWIELCVKNLIENALLHGSPPVSVRLSQEDGDLRIAVGDGGPGPSRLSQSAGMGLGLTLVRKVVAEMDGKLEFASAPTTFSIRLRGQA